MPDGWDVDQRRRELEEWLRSKQPPPKQPYPYGQIYPQSFTEVTAPTARPPIAPPTTRAPVPPDWLEPQELPPEAEPSDWKDILKRITAKTAQFGEWMRPKELRPEKPVQFPDMPSEGMDLGEGLRLLPTGEVMSEAVSFPVGNLDPETGEFSKSWQVRGMTVLEKVLTPLQRGFREIGKTMALPAFLESDRQLRNLALEGKFPEDEAREILDKPMLEILKPGELEKRYEKMPKWLQLMAEVAPLTTIPVSALGTLRALETAAARGAIPKTVAVAAQVALEATAIPTVERVTGAVVGAVLKYGIEIPIRYTGAKAFQVALDAGLDRWIATQGRLKGGEAQSKLAQLVIGDRNWLIERATQNLLKRQGRAKVASPTIINQAVDDTVQDAEARFLPKLLEAPPARPPAAPTFVPRLPITEKVTPIWGRTQAEIVEQAIPAAKALGRDIEAAKSSAIQAHKQDIQKAISEGKPVPIEVLNDYPELAIPKAEVGMPEAIPPEPVVEPVAKKIVTPPEPLIKPSAPEAPRAEAVTLTEEQALLLQRKAEIAKLLATPFKELPKGVKKIVLRQELAGVKAKLKPVEGKLRQQIMAGVKAQGLGIKQKEDIFKRVGGSRHLSEIPIEKLPAVLEAVRGARPVKIGGKTVVTAKTEQELQATKERFIAEGRITQADYDAILRLLKAKTDKYVSSNLFITEREGRNIIKAMRRKSTMGFAMVEEAIDKLVKALGPPAKLPPIITKEGLKEPVSKRFWDKLDSFANRTYRVERILERLDDFVEGGLFHKYVYKPINAATSQKIEGIFTKIEPLRQLLKTNKINIGKLTTDKIEIAPNVVLTPSEKIGVYLHSLNPDNLRHLKVGNKFSDELIEINKNSLTEGEKKVADWLHAYFEGEGPAISQVRMYVEDKPLNLVKDYFPIRLQWKAHPELDYWQQIAKTDSLKFAAEWPSARIAKGFLKERTPEAIQAVDLDSLSTFLHHLEAVEHYKAFAPVIGDLQLILKDQTFKTQLVNKAGASIYQVLDTWLKQVAEINPMHPTSHGEQIVRTLRVNAVTAVLGLNLTTALKQFPSFFSGMAEIGELPAMKGLVTFLAHPIKTRQLIKQFSPQIYKRSFEREIAEAKRMMASGKLIAGKLSPREVFMILTTTMDKVAVSSLWRGAFDDFLSKNPGDVKGAAEYGERVIRKTQPFFDVKDLPEYWRSGEFMKALTIFTNQLNNYWNYYIFDISGRYFSGRISTLEALRRIWWAFVVPALMIGAISRSDIPKNVKDLAKDFAGMAMATIPIMGSWISSALKGFSDSGLVTTELLDEMQRFAYNVSKGAWDKAGLAIPNVIGYAIGIPVAQPRRTIQGIIDLATDKTDDWQRLIWSEWTREQALTLEQKAKRTTKEIKEAMGKLGKRDEDAALKALEGITAPEQRQAIWNQDWTFATNDLARVLDSSLRGMDFDEVTEENGFSPLAVFYMESQQRMEQFYYALPSEGPARANFFAVPTSESIWTGADLVFWGKLSLGPTSYIGKNPQTAASVEKLVRQWMRDYNIPLSAVSSLEDLAEQRSAQEESALRKAEQRNLEEAAKVRMRQFLEKQK